MKYILNNIKAKKFELDSIECLNWVSTKIIDYVKGSLCIDEKSIFNLKLILSELVINGFMHGNAGQDQLLTATVSLEDDSRIVTLTVDDGGCGFNVDSIIPVTVPPVDKEQGRGLLLVTSLSDKVDFSNNGSRVDISITL